MKNTYKVLYILSMAFLINVVVIVMTSESIKPEPIVITERLSIVKEKIIEDKSNTIKNAPVSKASKPDRQYRCLVQALYHESRGEGVDGVLAVASVIKNRVESKRYPNDYCSVIHQPMQFSYVHERQNAGLPLDPKPKNSEKEIFEFIQETAKSVVNSDFESIFPREVMWYAHTRISNYWTRAKVQVAKVENHIFYKEKPKK